MRNGFRHVNRLRPYPAPAGSVAARPSVGRRQEPGVPQGGGGVDDILATLRKHEPKSMADLAEQMRADYQVKFADWILRANIQSVPVTIATDSPDPRAVAFADAMQDLWYATLNSMCDAIGDGRVAYAKCWQFDAATFLHAPKLTPLPFRATTMQLTADGEFAGIKLTGRSQGWADEKSIDIPVEQSWWLAIDATPIEPHGKSRYLGATQAEWASRREVFELRMTFLRKFCLNGGVIRGPGTVIDPTTNLPVPAAPLFQAAYAKRQQGGVMYMPGARNKDTGEFDFDVTETSRLEDPGPIDATLDKSDIRVLRSLGISELAVQQTGDLGSFAMAVIHRLVLNAVVAGLVSQFAESFEAYVIDAAAGYNFLPHETPDVTLTYPDLTAVPDSLMVEVAKAVLTSPTIPAGAALVNLKTIFEAAGIPITDDFEARLTAALEQAKAAAQPQPFGLQQPYQQPQQPAPRGVGMANEAAPAIPNLPNAATILADTTAEISAIFGQLFALAGQRASANVQEQERFDRELRAVLDELQRVVGASRFAMRVLGMLSPWLPQVQDNPRAVRQSGIGMANEAPGSPNRLWPFLDHALDFLSSREVLTPEQFRALSRDEQANAFTLPGVTTNIATQVQQEITVSFASGESLENFKQRLWGNLQLQESSLHTVFRTATHQAYVEGQDRALQSPAVAAEFPYVMFISTRDTRTRPAHRAVDGFVVKVGSREHELLKRLIRDWNCRCQLIPLTQADALARGVKTYNDIPQVTLLDLAV